MPTTQLIKGAFFYMGTNNPIEQPVVFQFNPETLVRQQVYSDTVNRVTESIRFKLVLNAMQGLEQDDEVAIEHGIYPQIAAFEELLEKQPAQAQSGGWPDWLFPSRRSARFLVFNYGTRIIPVCIQQLYVEELVHNTRLKPVHATIDFILRVLTERDLRGNVDGLVMLARYKEYRGQMAELSSSIAPGDQVTRI